MSDGFGGLTKFVANLEGARASMRKGAAKGLGIASRNTLDVSNLQVPWEEGDLSRDGGSSVDTAKLIAAVSYGRSAETKDRAVPQHEDMTFKHDPGRNAKYLENAINSTREQNLQIIAAAVKKEAKL